MNLSMPSLNRSSRSAKYKPNCLVPLLRCFQVVLRKLILEQVGVAHRLICRGVRKIDTEAEENEINPDYYLIGNRD